MNMTLFCVDRPAAVLASALTLVGFTLAPNSGHAACSEARELRLDSKLAEAEEAARACLESEPENPEVWMELSRILASLGEVEDALTWVNNAIDKAPDAYGYHFWKARLLARQDRLNEAWETLDALPSEAYDGNPTGTRVRADIQFWRGQNNAALNWYNEYLQMSEPNPYVLYNRGLIHKSFNNTEEARGDLKKSCEMNESATKACSVLNTMSEGSGYNGYAYAQGGYTLIRDRDNGWTGRVGVGSRFPTGTSVEIHGRGLSRTFPNNSKAEDILVGGQVGQQIQPGLEITAGGEVSLDNDFSPDWNAYLEPTLRFTDTALNVSLRYWRIEFPGGGVNVFSPAVVKYVWPLRFYARYYLAHEEATDTFKNSGIFDVSYFFGARTNIKIGGGIGDSSDFLELRATDDRTASDYHYLVLGGFTYSLTSSYDIGLTGIFRHEEAGANDYEQTDILMVHKVRF
jgi:tetratricopeptide (TPR) repeat protein